MVVYIAEAEITERIQQLSWPWTDGNLAERSGHQLVQIRKGNIIRRHKNNPAIDLDIYAKGLALQWQRDLILEVLKEWWTWIPIKRTWLNDANGASDAYVRFNLLDLGLLSLRCSILDFKRSYSLLLPIDTRKLLNKIQNSLGAHVWWLWKKRQ